MIEFAIAAMAAATPLVYTLIAIKLGVYLERRRIHSRLIEAVPATWDEYRYYHEKFDLDENPLDRRSPGVQ